VKQGTTMQYDMGTAICGDLTVDKIYHYTDLNGLKGIVENKSFWATSMQFLNDSEEIIHGMESIKNALPKLRGDIPDYILDSLISGMKKYDKRLSSNVFNISFCQKPELLSQWRGYANAQGVCLEFDRKELLDSLNFDERDHVAAEVIYSSKENPGIPVTQIKELFRKIQSLDSEDYNNYLDDASSGKFLSTLIPFMKNDSFSEEKEFRIVIYSWARVHGLEFRINKNGLIPYIEVSGRKDDDNRSKIPIKKVTIGPGPNADFMAQGVRRFLDYHLYGDTEVEQSQTPYRG